MNFIVSARTDIGLTKTTNQDSLSMRVVNTPQGRMVFAVLCDGMGGLDKGEVASASVIRAFDNWLRNDLPTLCGAPIEDSVIRQQWNNIVTVTARYDVRPSSPVLRSYCQVQSLLRRRSGR